jgi:tetratricopeptide (TPR) repeat protein
MRMVEKSSNGLKVTEEEPADSPISRKTALTIQRWKINGAYKNSHIAVFSSEKFSPDDAFHGKIVVDLSQVPQGAIKIPDMIGKYQGKYKFEIEGKSFPAETISGTIPVPDIDRKRSEHFYDQGTNFVKDKSFGDAISAFTETIRLYPKHERALFARGYCYGLTGQQQKALDDFNKVIELSPRHAQAYFNRAIAKRSIGGYEKRLIKDDFYKSWELGFESGLKEHLIESLDEINPSSGFIEFSIGNKKWLELNGQFITMIPHVSKSDFEIHGYRDKDNVFNFMIRNKTNEKAYLKFSEIEKLRTRGDATKHNIKITWYENEKKLYIDGALVDIFPKNISPSPIGVKDDGYLFRELSKVNPQEGRIEIDVSKESWSEADGNFISMIPHILLKNFEIYGYRDRDNVFKVLLSTASFDRAILHFKELSKLRAEPSHPKHKIQIAWNSYECRLLIDGNLVDSIKK